MSKNLYELMQMQEIATSNFLPSKKELELSSKTFVKNLIDAGEINKVEAFAQAERLTTAISSVRDELKASLPREKQTAYGIEINPVNGRQMIQFSEDAIWLQLNADLKAREELLKLALKQDVIDAYGNDVPKVSIKYSADSLTIKY
jgi:predicted transcriptional regulator